MRIAGEHGFTASREQVWAALQDPRLLAAALPGARRLEPTGSDAYALTVDVGVGSVTGTYEGTFALEDKRAGESCTVRASASGRPGSVQAVARMRLRDGPDGGAALAYEADADVTGPLAGVGQRLVCGAARRTTEQFLGRLDELIAAPPAEEHGPVPAVAAAPRGGTDPRVVAGSALAGFVLALIGVAVGRWTARR